MLLLHYTGMPSAQEALDALCDPAREVSAHYFIYENGKILSLVPEEHRAWHAGKAYWRGHCDINARSIGIELVNPGHEWGYRDFPSAQMDALIELAQGILKRNSIPARNVLAHSDVAPARKQDPGDRFDWGRLASEGIGLWVGQKGVEFWPLESDLGTANAFKYDLEHFGYDPDVPLDVVTTAFQRHYRPWRIDGNVDVESHRILRKLIAVTRES